MLRSGIDTGRLLTVGSSRTRTAALIAERYVELLSRDRLIDADAALVTAVKKASGRAGQGAHLRIFLCPAASGTLEEIEFIDALAGEDSVFYLPCGERASLPLDARERKPSRSTICLELEVIEAPLHEVADRDNAHERAVVDNEQSGSGARSSFA